MINPVLIIGPSIAYGGGTSERLLECLLTNTEPVIKPSGNGLVDVREVARAHLQAIKVPEAKNRRFLMQADELTKKEFAELLQEKYGPKGFNIFPWGAVAPMEIRKGLDEPEWPLWKCVRSGPIFGGLLKQFVELPAKS